MDNNSNKIARIIGQVFGIVLIGCLAACLSGTLIAATVKFLTWMF
jgi:uncharacterized membrane protein